jgi:hypothetical protein
MIFAHPLGLDLGPGPDLAVNIESRVPPGEGQAGVSLIVSLMGGI